MKSAPRGAVEDAANTAAIDTINLPLARYRLRLRVPETMRLPDYSGSAWRGVFGNSLKKLVCVTREPYCPDCLLYRSCVYPYIFETPPDPTVGKLRKYNAAPHPFVLRPGDTLNGTLTAGSEHLLYLTLFGRGDRQMPYILHALERAMQRGLGKQHGKLELMEAQQQTAEGWAVIYQPGGELRVDPATSVSIPACPEQAQLNLRTPLRIIAKGHLVTPDTFSFKTLFSSLLRRISMLTAFHSDAPLETDFAGLTRRAAAVSITGHRLRWREWTRYSSRQDSLMQMGGLLGRVTFEGRDLAPFWPYLWLGQWTHTGKGASMGLGNYEIVREK